MEVEAIGYALFNSASKTSNEHGNEWELYFGTGVLKAKEMLDIKPDITRFIEVEKDKISWPLFKLLSGMLFNESLESIFDSECGECMKLN